MENGIIPRHFTDRAEWRQWLQKNYDKETEVWFVFPLKSSGESAILYNDAVEEALCFGWIDSTVRSLDKDHKIQRFSPRNPKSGYSQANKERLRWLNDEGLIHSSVMESVSRILNEQFVYPKDIIEALENDEELWTNFQRFSDSYKRIRIAFIVAARDRPDEFRKRLNNFVEKTKKGKLIPGYGGIDKHY
ncbi:MAG: YdeI/OmpD-associated family protein [Methanomassiliicoccaceae archaeon]|jgi:uncharacterized protein YdeI (YjbR/CyaY-like superfamily)|nr:YdeI/OmpD-associated family protein [Methanomassiliicoccaceae archaeon]